MKKKNEIASVHSLDEARHRSQDNQEIQDPQNSRAQYERIADAFSTICEIEYGPFTEGTDIGDRKDRPVMNGIGKHMQEIFRRADFKDARTIRRFYAELRMWGDQLEAERERLHTDSATKKK